MIVFVWIITFSLLSQILGAVHFLNQDENKNPQPRPHLMYKFSSQIYHGPDVTS